MSKSTLPTRTRSAVPASGLAAGLLLALTAACGGGSSDDPTAEGGAAAAAPDDRPLTAAVAIYDKGGLMCVLCHGKNGEGSRMGPPIEDLDAHWNQDELASFLQDPVDWLPRKDHLTEVHAQYQQGMPKPNPSLLPPRDARLLAKWMLAGMPRE